MAQVKTAMLLAGMTALFGVVGLLIGGEGGLMIALVIAAGMNVFAYWSSDKMVLRMHNAREVGAAEAPDLVLGPLRIEWVNWWTVLLGLSFVAVTLFAPKGIAGIFDFLAARKSPDRHGSDLGPDHGSLREKEAEG